MNLDLNSAIGGGASILNLAAGINKFSQDLQFGEQERQAALDTKNLLNETTRLNLEQLKKNQVEQARSKKMTEDIYRMNAAADKIRQGVASFEEIRDGISAGGAAWDKTLASGNFDTILAAKPALESITKSAGKAMLGDKIAINSVKAGIATLEDTTPDKISITPDGIYKTLPNGTSELVLDTKKAGGLPKALKGIYANQKLTEAIQNIRDAAVRDGIPSAELLKLQEDAQTRNTYRTLADIASTPQEKQTIETLLALKNPELLKSSLPKMFEQVQSTINSAPAKAVASFLDPIISDMSAKLWKAPDKGLPLVRKQLDSIYNNSAQLQQIVKQSGVSWETYRSGAEQAYLTGTTTHVGIQKDLADIQYKHAAASAQIASAASQGAATRDRSSAEQVEIIKANNVAIKNLQTEKEKITDVVKSMGIPEEQKKKQLKALDDEIASLMNINKGLLKINKHTAALYGDTPLPVEDPGKKKPVMRAFSSTGKSAPTAKEAISVGKGTKQGSW